MPAFDTWIWFVIGTGLVALEMLAPGVFMFWLGLAAFGVGFLHLGLLGFGVSLSLAAHIVAFALLSLVAVAAGRRLSLSKSREEKPHLNERGKILLGRVFPLATAISQGTGTIRVDDTVWRVSGPDMVAGAPVRIVEIKGAMLEVAPVSRS